MARSGVSGRHDAHGAGDLPGFFRGGWSCLGGGLRDARGLAVIGAENPPCIVRAAAAAQGASMHCIVCGVSIGGAGDSLGVVGA